PTPRPARASPHWTTSTIRSSSLRHRRGALYPLEPTDNPIRTPSRQDAKEEFFSWRLGVLAFAFRTTDQSELYCADEVLGCAGDFACRLRLATRREDQRWLEIRAKGCLRRQRHHLR